MITPEHSEITNVPGDPEVLTCGTWIFLCVVCLFLVFVIIVSIFDDGNNIENETENSLSKCEIQQLNKQCPNKHRGLCNQILLCFSVRRNIKAVFGDVRDRHFEFFNGLRIIVFYIVVTNHVKTKRDESDENKAEEDVLSRLVANADVANTSLFIGGFFCSVRYLIHKTEKRPNLLVLLRALFARYLRLFPPVSFLLLLKKNFRPYAWEGPPWVLDQCQFSGITDFLLIPFRLKCCTHLWYLEVDFKCFCLGLLLIYVYECSEKIFGGAVVVIWLLIILCAIKSDQEYLLGCKDTNHFLKTQTAENNIFTHFTYRAGVYIMGLLLGICWFKTLRHGKIMISLKKRKLLNLLSIVLRLGVSYRKNLFGELECNLGYVLAWSFWGMGLGCLAYVCLQDKTDLNCRFLSMRIWRPLSNLTFSAYLIHADLIEVVSRNHTKDMARHSRYGSPLWLAVCCYFLAVPFSLLFELPFLQIGRVIQVDTAENKILTNQTPGFL